MNAKEGSFAIKMPALASKAKKGDSIIKQRFIWRLWKFVKEDPNRVKLSFKVGLAVILVSLLILLKAPYNILGPNIIWAVMTVALMFENAVGATFNKGINRALGSLLAGILADAIGQLALCSGRVLEPVIIGISVFLIGAVTTFMKQWPSLVQFEYGFRVIFFTYCFSGYPISNLIKTSVERLYSIGIGCFVSVVVDVLVFPVWAGEQLEKELVGSFNSVADSLEEFVKKYLEDDGLDHPDEFFKNLMVEFPDDPAYKKCKSTLDSYAKLESLANSAKWELRLSRFRHPWLEYVKVGAVLRYCAVEVMALHGVLHSKIQAPHELRIKFRLEIEDATTQAAELIRSLAKDICKMNRSIKTASLMRLHSSTEQLQRAINLYPHISTNLEPPGNPSNPFPKPCHALSVELDDEISEAISTNQTNQVPASWKLKQSRRTYSWPSREADAFEKERGAAVDFVRRMRGTAALSIATFTSLLVEFVARLDHLVEAVDQLSKMAVGISALACGAHRVVPTGPAISEILSCLRGKRDCRGCCLRRTGVYYVGKCGNQL